MLNLTDRELPNNQMDLLNLGPKFVPIVKKIPFMDIITTTEIKAIELEKKEKPFEAERLRQSVQQILKKAKKPTSNLTKDQSVALRELKTDNNFDVYPFDKGSGFVIINHEDALKRIEDQIGHTKKVNRDPTKSLVSNFQRTLRKMKKEEKFSDRLYRQLYPTDAVPPRMYGMIKAHKPAKNYPMRIVVSTIGSPPYQTSKYLVKIIQPTLNKNDIRVINSTSFVEEAKSWNPSPNEIQVSYDAVNLYPSVPIQKAISAIMEIITDDADDFKTRTKLSLSDVRTLIELCLKKCYFTWKNDIRELDDAGPIGLSLMVVIAEAFLQYIERKAINKALRAKPSLAPITYKRYVDDSHCRFPSFDIADKFLDILNQEEPKIQFTIEYENEQKEMNFLDVTIKNTGEGNFIFKVYRKDAITNVQIQPSSAVPKSIKDGVFKGFLSRAYSICSPQYIQEEIDFLKNVFIENGYDEAHLNNITSSYVPPSQRQPIAEVSEDEGNNELPLHASLPWVPGVSEKLRKEFKKANIKTTFKSTSNLKDILCSKNKSTLPPLSMPGVYMVSCSCGKKYVGETGANIKTRINQHQKASFDGKIADSALAEHDHTCNGTINWDGIKILSREDQYYRRCIRESLEIRKENIQPGSLSGLNRDSSKYVETNSWQPILNSLKD